MRHSALAKAGHFSHLDYLKLEIVALINRSRKNSDKPTEESFYGRNPGVTYVDRSR
jgi:hypothetical protein